MEKAMWNGKEIIALNIAEKYEIEKAVRKASGRKELLCPDKNCTHRVLRYCHGEKKDAYFAHINNTDCAYEKYDKGTSDIVKNIKRILYFYFQSKNYDVSMDVKLIEGHYTHLSLKQNDKLYAMQIISKFSSANRIDDFFIKYQEANIPVIWIVTDLGENDIIDESEMNYAKRFSINETSDNSIITIDLKGENVTLYKMDTNEYLYDGYSIHSDNYPKIFVNQYPLEKLEFSDGVLTVPDFNIQFESFLTKKAAAFDKYKKEKEKEKQERRETLEKQSKEIEKRNKELDAKRQKEQREREEKQREEKEKLLQAEREEARKKEMHKAKQREKLKPLSRGYEIGDKIEHKRFGVGTVVDIIGNLITIDFSKRGIKNLALNAEINQGSIKKL
ncbi:MAG: hypothetical protein J1E81_09310 [Eubacterium sp.]|nr:hypothetical protein [Eubacterium sp.]